MLTAAENELLVRVGPGTPGGTLMRKFWHPVLKSVVAEPGGEPHQVRLLGEDFVVFRSPNGEVGLVDEFCPHRLASLAIARNEECGLRCIFHGWKVGLDGKVLEVPSEPPDRRDLAHKVKTRAHAVREAAGIIWAYIGGGDPPPFCNYPFANHPIDHIDIAQVPGKCNWAQLSEGQIDSSHLSFLHSSTVTGRIAGLALGDRSPVFEVENTPWGFHVAATRGLQDGRKYTRITEFAMPYWQFIPPAAAPETPEYAVTPRFGVCQVPNDDVTSTVWYVMWHPTRPIVRGEVGAMWEVWNRQFQSTLGQHKWAQDREQMKAGHFTGIDNLLAEDMAVGESMGPIADRTRETLGSSDTGVARFRRVYLEAARKAAAGEVPRGCGPDVPYPKIMGVGTYHAADVDWRNALDPQLV